MCPECIFLHLLTLHLDARSSKGVQCVCWYLFNHCDTLNLHTTLSSQNNSRSRRETKTLQTLSDSLRLRELFTFAFLCPASFLSSLRICVSHCSDSVMTVSKTHTWGAGKKAIVVGWAASFLCGPNAANTLVWLPTHSLPFSTCAECQTRSIEGVALSQTLWWAPVPLIPTLALILRIPGWNQRLEERQGNAIYIN